MRSNRPIKDVIAQWTRLGAMFNTSAARHEVDIEQLLLDTVRHCSANSRLFILAATWLVQFGDYVAKHRLTRMIRFNLEPQHLPTLGLLLEIARQKSGNNSHRFNQSILACGSAIDQRPLLDIDRKNDFFISTAKTNASPLSKKWGRWMEEFELKTDAIRPTSWILQKNPSLRWRADFRGDLRASILAELQTNPDAGASESELARACGATRAAIIQALDKLQMSGRISRRRRKNRLAVQTIHRRAA